MVHKQGNWTLWFRESFEVNFNIGFRITIEFPSQRRKIIKIGPKTRNWTLVVQCGRTDGWTDPNCRKIY